MKQPATALLAQARLLFAVLAALVINPSSAAELRTPGNGLLPVIGVITVESRARHPELDAFFAGLRDRGYVDGQNIVVEVRTAEYQLDRLPAMAADLVSRKVAVIVALQPPSFTTAMAATRTIPIVIRSSADPVKAGFIRSLAKPGGNVTGVTSFSGDLYSKRLELAQELIPGVSLVAVLSNPDSPTSSTYMNEVKTGAAKLGLKLLPLEVRNSAELPGAFAAARAAHAGVVVPLRDPVMVGNRSRIAALASEYRLPAIYDDREFVEAGGLISYGADLTALHRRSAYFVDRILRGASASDLPVEGPKKFEMVVNLSAARAIKLKVPRSILLIADQVIE
jgi:putative ABC transport system substrate-binding protein